MILSSQKNADSWLSLHKKMHEAMESLHIGWAYSPNLDVPKDVAEQQWDAFWFRHRKEVDSWLLRWMDGEKIEEPNKEIRFLIACRFHAVALLCNMLSFVNGGSTLSPFPFPEGSEKEVLCALLMDWCIGKGMFIIFDEGWIAKMNID